MKRMILVIVLLGNGCATLNATSIEMVSPDGKKWIGIDCDGHSQVACYAEAGRQCPSGYDIISEDGHFHQEYYSGAYVNQSVAISKSSTTETHSGSMIISCHGMSWENDVSYCLARNAVYNRKDNTCVHTIKSIHIVR